MWLGRTLEARLMRAESIDPSLRAVLARVLRALLVMVAVLIAMSMVGLDLTVLSVFGGALGVGLGLGMQRIASNYVSGFIILLDRGLRIGDTITVDKYSGRVTDIKTRYTVVRALDGNDAVIPNELLVSQPVLNHSLSTPRVCISLHVRVVHGTEVAQAFAIMDAAARAHPRVLAVPAPACHLRELGTEGLDLELAFWIADPQNGSGPVKSDLNLAILHGFTEARIEIPHPAHIPGIVRASNGAV
jgi:small-conductance mechanosensitive channel